MRIAVLIPCYNEAQTISQVVEDFRASLPEAEIYVYDNNSSDKTIANALNSGAIVRREARQGKGFVIRRMFRDIEADVYVMVDGDATYQSSKAQDMINALTMQHLDMVIGRRIAVKVEEAYRRGHVLGNQLFTRCVTMLFGKAFQDIFSGYRVFSRRFVKSFPITSSGFEIETELAIHALDQGLSVAEIDTEYYARPEGSHSKLNTYKDGFKILRTILTFMRHDKPLMFYGSIAAIFALVSLFLSFPIFIEYHRTGGVSRLPTAVLCTGLMVLSGISITCGLVLDSVSRMNKAIKQLHYLSQ